LGTTRKISDLRRKVFGTKTDASEFLRMLPGGYLNRSVGGVCGPDERNLNNNLCAYRAARGAKILAKLLGQEWRPLMAFSWDLIYICHPTGSRRFLLSLFRFDHTARLLYLAWLVTCTLALFLALSLFLLHTHTHTHSLSRILFSKVPGAA